MKNSNTKKQILDKAYKLFSKNGYSNTSIESIIKEVNIAKGTFYHHFESKEDLLKEIVEVIINNITDRAKKVAKNKKLTSMEKMELILSSKSEVNTKASVVKEGLHKNENRELHEQVNIQLVQKLSPIITSIVIQGIEEKIFKVKRPLETVQFLVAGSQFLFDEGIFKWDDQEYLNRRIVMQDIVETSLGAKEGSFSFLINSNAHYEKKI